MRRERLISTLAQRLLKVTAVWQQGHGGLKNESYLVYKRNSLGKNTLQRDGVHVTPELVARLSPYLTEHIKRFGQYLVDMNAPPVPFDIKPLFMTLT